MPTRRTVFTLAAAAALAACGAPIAHAEGSLVDLQVVDRHQGDVLPVHRHRGAAYVAGRPGERYAIRLSNRSGARVLVVLSVDGINAVSGETAATGQTGYVLSPWQTADITGWRKSHAEAAAFYFTALPDSYAARTERPDHVGVIGAAVFRERVVRPRPQPYDAVPYPRGRDDGGSGARQEPESRLGAAAAEGAATAAPRSAPPDAPAREQDARSQQRAEKLGTGHGEREYSPIGRTAFERASSQPAEIVEVRYDSRPNLIARGVIRPHHAGGPNPFPGFVPDPR